LRRSETKELEAREEGDRGVLSGRRRGGQKGNFSRRVPAGVRWDGGGGWGRGDLVE